MPIIATAMTDQEQIDLIEEIITNFWGDTGELVTGENFFKELRKRNCVIVGKVEDE